MGQGSAGQLSLVGAVLGARAPGSRLEYWVWFGLETWQPPRSWATQGAAVTCRLSSCYPRLPVLWLANKGTWASTVFPVLGASITNPSLHSFLLGLDML